MIREIYKRDYRGYEKLPKRRDDDAVKLLKYSKSSDRNQIRKYLMEDFNSKCAYCGWENASYSEGVFHIEHTKSKSHNATLIDCYEYLALACPICNCSKNAKEAEYFIDPLDESFQKLFYRNKYGAIVVNNEIQVSEKLIAQNYLDLIGLHKELYKLDYIKLALNRIKKNEIKMENRDLELICEIVEIIDYIDEVARRRTIYTDF